MDKETQKLIGQIKIVIDYAFEQSDKKSFGQTIADSIGAMNLKLKIARKIKQADFLEEALREIACDDTFRWHKKEQLQHYARKTLEELENDKQ